MTLCLSTPSKMIYNTSTKYRIVIGRFPHVKHSVFIDRSIHLPCPPVPLAPSSPVQIMCGLMTVLNSTRRAVPMPWRPVQFVNPASPPSHTSPVSPALTIHFAFVSMYNLAKFRIIGNLKKGLLIRHNNLPANRRSVRVHHSHTPCYDSVHKPRLKSEVRKTFVNFGYAYCSENESAIFRKLKFEGTGDLHCPQLVLESLLHA